MIEIVASFWILHPVESVARAGGILISKIVNDYWDQTIPDAAYYKGWLETKTELYSDGWKTGRIRQWKA